MANIAIFLKIQIVICPKTFQLPIIEKYLFCCICKEISKQ